MSINDRIALVVEKSGLSKTAFAERLNVSQQYVSKLTKAGTPSDRTIISMCREFNISEQWLRTGEGDMLIQISRESEIAAFIGDILKGDDNFKRRFISVLSRMTAEEWAILERKVRELSEEK